MSLSSPYLHRGSGVTQVMLRVLLALVPGTAVATILLGPGVPLNILLCVGTALLCEAILLQLRGRPVRRHLLDLSAVISAVLLALSLPPWLPWWQPVLGTAFAIIIGKQLFGGLGYNPFNPAMLGYVVLLISFPVSMTVWPAMGADVATPWAYIFASAEVAGLDALTAATPLDQVRSGLLAGQTLSELRPTIMTMPALALVGAWLIGGLYMLWQRVIDWRIPLAVLAGIAMPALIFSIVDPDRYASVGFHWLYGASVFGALFIATDPVSGSTTPRGRLVYGFCIGLLTWIIRSFGGYPDAIAFAVLLLNIAAPLIDQYTPTRVYGTGRREPR